MTVLSHKLHSVGASGSASGSNPDNVAYGYTARFLVKCDSSLDGPKTILNYFKTTSGLPWFGDSFKFGNDTDSNAKCREIAPSVIPNSEGWHEVDVKYEQAGGGSSDTTPPTNLNADGKETDDPEDWNDDLDVSYTQISVPVEVATFRGFTPDIFNPFLTAGKVGPVVNSAFVPFDPPPEMEIDVKVLRFTKWIPDWDGTIGNKWIGVVNDAAVNVVKPQNNFKDTWGPFTARIKNFSGTFVMTAKGPWWKETKEVHVNPLGWRGVISDRGLTRRAFPGDKDADGNVISDSDIVDYKPAYIPLRDEDGYQITEPILLNGNGQPLKPGRPPVYLIYSYYEEKNFGGIVW